MNKLLALAFMLSTVATPGFATDLNGEVSATGEATAAAEPLQEQAATLDTRISEPADSQNQPEKASADDGTNPMQGVRVLIYQQKLPRLSLGEFVNLMRQSAATAQDTKSHRRGSAQMLEGGAEDKLSAIGIAFAYPSGYVQSVDPASDLSGKVVPGDTILGIDGMAPLESLRQRANLGGAGSIVQVTYSHNGTVATLPCKRQPIANFSAPAQAYTSNLPELVSKITSKIRSSAATAQPE